MKLIFTEDSSQRIDKYLANLGKKELYSRTFIDKLIKEGFVKVNGRAVKKSHHLNPDDTIEIEIPELTVPQLQAENIPLQIVYEDDHLAIVNKQAGLTVHPAPGNETGTLVNALLYYFSSDLSSGSAASRPGIVHRLDKDTTGLLMIAKNDRVHSLLSRMFQGREIEKYYLAISVGIPDNRSNLIKTNLDRSRRDRKKMSVHSSGKEAITRFRIIRRFDPFSVLYIKLVTGRTHQIRVHFSHLNCPLLGDNTYSSQKRTLSYIQDNFRKKVKYLLSNHLKRQALHSYRLKFVHPITHQIVKVKAPLPDDIEYTINWLKENFIS